MINVAPVRGHFGRGTLLGVLALLATTGSAAAAGGPSGFVHAKWTPFQLALSPGGVQVFHQETEVKGWRLSLLYGKQQEVVGLDTGFFSDAHALDGVQVGVGNQVLGDLHGLQAGIANGAGHGKGLQIGVLNRAGSLEGLQLGVLNFNEDGFLPVFPLFNFSAWWR